MSKKKRIFRNSVILPIIIAMAIVLAGIALRLYFAMVDEKVKNLLDKTDVTYEVIRSDVNEHGLYEFPLKSELSEFVKNKKIKSLTCQFGSDFEIAVEVLRTDDDINFVIEKINSEEYGISARMHMTDIESVEYQTGNPEKSTVLKLNQSYNYDYMAMSNGFYYFLGNDIESISYIDDHFYYVSYNPKYKILTTDVSCTKEIKNSIDEFSMKEYYYRYGKLNFLEEYYQKLSSKVYTVQNRCDELGE